MHRFFSLLAILSLPNCADAAQLSPMLLKAESNVVTFDPFVFGPGPTVDVYHFVVGNYANDFPATSLSIDLRGSFINMNTSPISFKSNNSLPTLGGPNTVADTYFVVPDASKVLAVRTIDSSTQLASSYTTQGGATLIPARGEAVVAVLSVLAGSAPPRFPYLPGYAVVNGALERIAALPEPTTCVLAGLALVGAVARRRV